MVGIIGSRGLATDEHRAFILEREGYYPVLNGYKDPFIDRAKSGREGDDRHISGASFTEVYALFAFDRHLRSTLFKYITIAKAVLKSVCSYKFSERHPRTRRRISTSPSTDRMTDTRNSPTTTCSSSSESWGAT